MLRDQVRTHGGDVERLGDEYLKANLNWAFGYLGIHHLTLETFSVSDYAKASLDKKSTIGVMDPKSLLNYGFNFMNTKIYIDNESTICIYETLEFHSKTKHIEIRHHFIRDCYEKKLIQVIKIHTDHNVADLLTKAFDVSSTVRLSLYCWMKLCTKVDAARLMRSDLLFNDEDDIACLTNDEIFENLALMGYKQLSTKLTFQKAPEGEGSPIPPEPQPTPSTSQPNVSEPQTESLQTETPPTVSHELQTEAHIEQILLSPSTYQRKQRKTKKHRRAKLVTALPQTSVPLDYKADEVVHKEGVTMWKRLSLLLLA
ncbi:hypothetical protein Tco_1103075 [Tanacetum coccineum]